MWCVADFPYTCKSITEGETSLCVLNQKRRQAEADLGILHWIRALLPQRASCMLRLIFTEVNR